MTKLETLLRLSEIKGAMLAAESMHVPINMVEDWIEELEDDADEEEITCEECISDSMKVFNAGYPGKEVIQRWAKDFHENYRHRSPSCHGCGQYHD